MNNGGPSYYSNFAASQAQGFSAIPNEGSIVGSTGAGGYVVGHAGGVVATDEAGNYGHGYGYGYQTYPAQGQGQGQGYAGQGFAAAPGYGQGVAQPGPAPVIGYSAQVQSTAAPAPVPVGGQCHFVDATVVKSIHAICVSADGHQFPASHMTPDTWINASYEGEIARCLPGSTLRILVGSVLQSDQGLATSDQDAQALICGAGEAVRHFKNGMLKCAPAEKVVDCTERTNLRKYGTGDMFFTYVTKVCLEQHQNLVSGGQTRESPEEAASRAQSYARTQAQSRELHLTGMTLNGGVGGLGFY